MIIITDTRTARNAIICGNFPLFHSLYEKMMTFLLFFLSSAVCCIATTGPQMMPGAEAPAPTEWQHVVCERAIIIFDASTHSVCCNTDVHMRDEEGDGK